MKLNTIKTIFLLSSLTIFFVLIGGMIGGRNGAMIAFIIACGINFFSYWFSASIVLKMYKAQEVNEQSAPQLFASVRKLATNAGLPMPKVYIIQSGTPNAFATGRNPQHGVVAVTTALMQMLNTDELEGVIAHELSHIKGRDILIGTIAATIAGAVMMLADFARFAAIFGGHREDSENGGSNPVVMIVVALIAPIAATIIQLAVSRTREYEADASAAKITKKPMALASALKKIAYGVEMEPMGDKAANTAHMFIINPLSGKKALNLFSTHPAIEDRIEKLEELEKSLNGTYTERYYTPQTRKNNPLFR